MPIVLFWDTLHVFIMADQCKILFWKKALSDNRIVSITVNVNRPHINMLLSKHSITSINMKIGKIKNLMWRQFVDSAYSKGNLNFY